MNKLIPLLPFSFALTILTKRDNAQSIPSQSQVANVKLSNLTSPTAIDASLVPQTNNSISLGSPALQWNNLYVNNLNLKSMSNAGSSTITGNLGVSGMTTLNTANVSGMSTLSAANVSNDLGVSGITTLNMANVTNTLTGNCAVFSCGTVTNLTSDAINVNTAAGINCYASHSGPLNFFWNNQLSGQLDPFHGNVSWGFKTLNSNPTGFYNTAIGDFAMAGNIGGEYNTGIGAGALGANISGNRNIGVGIATLRSNTSGSDLIALGYFVDASSDGLSNSIAIGNGSTISTSNQVAIGNSSITSIGGFTDWTNFSDGRYKKNIKQNVPGLEFINKLQPITYTLDVSAIDSKLHNGQKEWKGPDGKIIARLAVDKSAAAESSKIVHTGFVAQDVEKAASSLGYDFSGVDKPKDPSKSFYGLRYGDFVVPLVKAVQELSEQNDSLKSEIAQLRDRVSKMEQVLEGANGTSGLSDLAKLYQNVPNPTNHTTMIGYYLPETSDRASIQVTDMNGQILKSIPISSKGNGHVILETANFSSGIYNYSFIVDGKLIDAKKMVLAK